jgi:hypothetical protein
MNTCIRRPGATWTTCRCPACLRHRAKVRKANENGRLAPARSDEAWAVLEWMIAARWSPAAIASATGITADSAHRIVASDRVGSRVALTRPTANAILNAGTPTAGHIGAHGATRRMQALAVMGHSLAPIAALTGLPSMTLSVIRSGGVATTSPGNHTAVAAAFRQLAMKRGESGHTKARAARLGWVGPLAWDDIDDPAAVPVGAPDDPTEVLDDIAIDLAVQGRLRTTLSVPERHAAVTRLAALGHNDTEIAARVHVSAKTVLGDRKHLGIPAATNNQWSAA